MAEHCSLRFSFYIAFLHFSFASAPAPMPVSLLELDPISTLRSRLRAELGDSFHPARPIRVSRAPGRLDVMGGIADYTGSLVCEATLDRAAAVALQERDDGPGDRQL